MSYQSLYRRYRPRRFADVRGQDHVVVGLRNAVREGRVGHAYLFSGPRGTGKTSTARILAKALNCENPQDGEPCLECASCVAIEAGTSFDVHELDAASNNGVDAIRDLIASTALASPGRHKLYILDEVHMLSPGAENAFLKTLEEPPEGVVFVLATTDPHKVRPTIRSRAQHFEFHLLPSAELDAYVRDVIADAGIELSDEAIEHALRVGAGSARDTLSAVDQLVAAGGVAERGVPVDEVVEALADRDPGRALAAVADAVRNGRDPRVLGEQLVHRLRDVFLSAMKAPLDHLGDADRDRIAALTERFERPFITRCLEGLGDAMAKMPEAADRRILLETALVRLADIESDVSPAALLERIERLERALASGSPPPQVAPVTAHAGPPAVAPDREAPPATGAAAGAKEALAAARRNRPARAPTTTPATAPSASPPARPSEGRSAAGDGPSRDDLTLAWADEILPKLPRLVRARFATGRFLSADGGVVRLGLPNAVHVAKCEEMRADVEAVLAEHFGAPVRLELVVDVGEAAASPPARGGRPRRGPVEVDPSPAPEPDPEPEPEEVVDVHELEDAPTDTRSGLDRIAEAFPGAQLVEGEP